MASKTFEMAFELGAKLSSGFRSTFQGAAAQLQMFDDRVKSLGQTAAVAQKFQALQNSMGTLATEAQAARAKVAALQASLEAQGKGARDSSGRFVAGAGEMRKELAAAEKQMQRLNNAEAAQRAELERLGGTLRGAGVDTSRLGAEQQRLARELDRAASAQKRMREAQGARQAARANVGEARGRLFDAVAIGATAAGPAAAAIKFESAMADVRKVTNLEGKDLQAMSNKILEMSSNIAMSGEGIAQIVAAGGQSGIEKDQLLAFAQDAAKMAVAFDISAESAGTYMAKWRTAFGIGQTQVVSLADAVNELSNTQASKADEIANVLFKVGSAATAAGFKSEQVAAFGSAMISAGAASDVAATAMKNFSISLSLGNSASNTQKKAFEALGMSSTKVAKNMQKDAEATSLAVIKQLQTLPEYKRIEVAESLFGRESLGAIMPLIQNTKTLEQGLTLVGNKTKTAGSMAAEYANRADTTSNSLLLLKNSAMALVIQIGTAMLPAIRNVAAALAPAAQWIGKMTQQFPTLTTVIAVGTAATAALAVGVAALGYAWSLIYAGWTSIVALYTTITTSTWAQALATKAATAASFLWAGVTKVMTAAQWLFNASLYGCPVFVIIGAIAAIVAAGIWMYKNWDIVTAAFTKSWQWIKDVSAPVVSWFIENLDWLAWCFGPVVGGAVYLYKNWETVTAFLSSSWDTIKAAAQPVIDWLGEKIGWLVDKWNAFKGVFSGTGEAAAKLGSTTAAISPAQTVDAMTSVPAFAKGGFVNGPTLAMVGEAGPEAIVPLNKSGASIWQQAGASMGMGGGMSVNFSPTINVNGNASQSDIMAGLKAGADDLIARMQAALANERRLSYV